MIMPNINLTTGLKKIKERSGERKLKQGGQ
jgi:hypothetical protein